MIRVGLLIAAVTAASAAGANGEPRYVLTSLSATVRSAQVAHEGPGEDGDGAATVTLSAGSHPQLRLHAAAGRPTVSIRVSGAGEAHARFVLAERAGVPSRSAECSSTLLVAPQRAPVTFALGHGTVRVQLALPFVRAPFVEATDLYPASGPCDMNTGAVPLTLVVARTFNSAVFARRRVTLTLSGRRPAQEGDIAYTTTWRATLTLTRR